MDETPEATCSAFTLFHCNVSIRHVDDTMARRRQWTQMGWYQLGNPGAMSMIPFQVRGNFAPSHFYRQLCTFLDTRYHWDIFGNISKNHK